MSDKNRYTYLRNWILVKAILKISKVHNLLAVYKIALQMRAGGDLIWDVDIYLSFHGHLNVIETLLLPSYYAGPATAKEIGLYKNMDQNNMISMIFYHGKLNILT